MSTVLESSSCSIAVNVENRTQLLPKAAFDTHVHVFDPILGPYAPGRAYTPDDAPLESLISFNKSLTVGASTGNLVLVQPSPYKSDCTVLMHCLRALKQQGTSAYAIMVVNLEEVSDEELYKVHLLGARGIRLNFQADGEQVDLSRLIDQLQRTAQRICHLPGWMIQLFVPAWTWEALHDHILALPVNVIADHLGGLRGSSKLSPDFQSIPLSQPGFKSLVSLAKQSRVIVKVSGLYRLSNETQSNFNDMEPIIQTLGQEIPRQLIWGSDWPHTGEGKDRTHRILEVKEPFRQIDSLGILHNLQQWIGQEAWTKMVQENPERLFRPIESTC